MSKAYLLIERFAGTIQDHPGIGRFQGDAIEPLFDELHGLHQSGGDSVSSSGTGAEAALRQAWRQAEL